MSVLPVRRLSSPRPVEPSLRRLRAPVCALAAVAALLAGCSSTATPEGSATPVGSTPPGGSVTVEGAIPATGSTLRPVPLPTPTSLPPSAAHGCPPDATHLPFSGSGAAPRSLRGTTTLAVPPGVTGAQVCRYGSTVVGAPARLVASRSLDAASAARLLAVVDTVVPPIPDQLGHMSCPYAGSGAVLVRFGYPDGSTADVVARLTGCEQATSAHGTMTHRPDLVRALRALI